MGSNQSGQQFTKTRRELWDGGPCFYRPLCALVELDRIENGEERWQTIGVVEGVLTLMVAHTVREQDDIEVIRIISARRGNRRERSRYEEENG
jgi:uncharacterized DUF497 family protein